MAEKHDLEGSSSSNVTDRILDSTVELNVKTLDSQNYHFNVDRNITVLAFKEKIASQIGLPVVQQRLIFRGKVLQDNDLLSDYYVDSGHTLHLVERQPSVSQPSSGATSGGTNPNDGSRGQEPGVGGPRNRIGHISHSIMLGTLNVGDQGEGAVPDISRVIGSVLNSIGIGSQMAGGFPGMQFNGPVTTPQENETEGSRSGAGAQSQSGNQSSNGQTFAGMSIPQAVQIPVGAAIAIPTLSTPIPDSLNTLSEFMNRMERAFGRNDPANQSPGSTEDLPRVELPTNSNGGATLEGLSIVLRQAEQLIGGRAVAALSHIAGRLEQEAGSTDSSVRGEIQAEAGQLGLEMQHLGALFLELGRTILTTRLGQSLAESSVNAGPSVYISPTGPNPIMVQPFPLQPGSLFGSSTPAPVNSAVVGPPSGNIPRNVNIHIHAVGMRGGNGEGSLADRNGGSGDSGQTRAMPMRNVTTTGTQSQPATISISGHPDASASQHPSASLSSALSELNSRLRHLVDTMPSELWAPRDQSDISNVGGQSAGNDANETTPDVQTKDTGVERNQQAHDQELRPCDNDNAEGPVNFKEPSGSSAGSSNILTGSSKFSADGSSQSSHDDLQGSSATPLGLGFGSLQPKRRSRQSKVQTKSGATSSPEQSRAVGQQVLQSLGSLGNRQSTENAPGGSLPSSTSSVIDGIPVGSQNTDAQLDITNTMSQILQSPALGGLLTGVSQQTGLGSPDALRNMMGQLTQNPAMRNTVNQIAQQIDSQDLASMFSGMASGQGAGIDLSRMMQQMMPIVTQALGGASSFRQSTPSVEIQRPQSRPRRDVPPTPNTTQIDLQQVSRRIEERSPPQEILRSLIENAVNLDGVTIQEDSLIELCSVDELVNDFMHMLCEDVSRRLDS